MQGQSCMHYFSTVGFTPCTSHTRSCDENKMLLHMMPLISVSDAVTWVSISPLRIKVLLFVHSGPNWYLPGMLKSGSSSISWLSVYKFSVTLALRVHLLLLCRHLHYIFNILLICLFVTACIIQCWNYFQPNAQLMYDSIKRFIHCEMCKLTRLR